ncbi:MAG: hypothetical protein NUV98_00065 [Candidatus Roizmanbacteria bacterium]|nr:hypothetical protein [Candidatus Roizmanbacteria bacterium]
MIHQTGNYKTNTGAVVKAAVFGAMAGAAAVVLSDKKKRKAILDTFHNLKEKGKQKLNEAQEAVDIKKEEAQKQLAKNLGRAKQKLEKT